MRRRPCGCELQTIGCVSVSFVYVWKLLQKTSMLIFIFHLVSASTAIRICALQFRRYNVLVLCVHCFVAEIDGGNVSFTAIYINSDVKLLELFSILNKH